MYSLFLGCLLRSFEMVSATLGGGGAPEDEVGLGSVFGAKSGGETAFKGIKN